MQCHNLVGPERPSGSTNDIHEADCLSHAITIVKYQTEYNGHK